MELVIIVLGVITFVYFLSNGVEQEQTVLIMKRPYVNFLIEETENNTWIVIVRIPSVEIVLAEFKTQEKAERCASNLTESLGREIENNHKPVPFTPLGLLHESTQVE